MTGPLYRLGTFCVRHRFVVAPLWVALAVALIVVSGGVGRQTSDDVSLPGTDSQRAADTLSARFPDQANGMVPISFAAPAGHRLTDADAKQAIDRVTTAYADDTTRVAGAIGPFDPQGADQLSPGKTHGYIALQLKDGSGELTADEAHALIDTAEPLGDAGLEYAAGGYLGQKVSKAQTDSSEAVGLVAAVVILLMTFGTVVAMGLPIVTAITGLAIGLSVVGLLGQLVDVPSTAPALATMIGLGVGIDYALFVITRHRQQLHEGMACDESIARAVATSGGAVVFAGGTVIVALISLLLAGIPIVTTLGWTAAAVVLVPMLGAVSLLPALLVIIGSRINALPIPGARGRTAASSGPWARWARAVARRPWPAVAASVLVLVLLSVPILQLELGQSDDGALLRDTTLPDATAGTHESAHVGGITAGYVDLADAIAAKLPLVIAVVLGLSFVLLLVAFRSVVVPLKAAVMNLLSIGAAFGIVTCVFGHDWSAGLLGLDGAQPIVSYVPLMMFAILFGLSMDYEVFLMAHIRERFAATGDAHRAVVEGVAGTARVITSAALIMVAVFLAFLLSGDPTIKQFGLGMAAAVAIDATLIRCGLVPAVMALLGPRAWRIPGRLARWLPEFSIEGEGYFASRDAAAPAPAPDPEPDAVAER